MSVNYRGERFSAYNKPKRTPGKSKKFAVLAKDGDKVRLVRFGDPNMSIKKNIPARRKSFRARKRIKKGSGEKMRKPGSKGAPTAKAFKKAAKTARKRK